MKILDLKKKVKKVSCNIGESETCQECKDKICGKYPIIDHIVFSEDVRKIKGLNNVLSKFNLKVIDYLKREENYGR